MSKVIKTVAKNSKDARKTGLSAAMSMKMGGKLVENMVDHR